MPEKTSAWQVCKVGGAGSPTTSTDAAFSSCISPVYTQTYLYCFLETGMEKENRMEGIFVLSILLNIFKMSVNTVV